MRKSVQLAKVQIGVYEFKVIKKKTSEYEAEFLLYREWGEYTPVGVKKHKTLDGKYEFYAQTLSTLAYYQDYYENYCRVPSAKEVRA